MSNTVEFYFDVGSPTTYLAWTRLPRMCAAHNAELVYKPVLLGAIFKATGNASPVMVPAKGRHMLTDLGRFAARYGVDFQFNPHFPINTLTLMRIATGVQMREPTVFDDYLKAVFEGLWVRQLNLGEPDVIAQVLTGAGLDAQPLMALAQDDAVKTRLKETTDEAIERGVFGCPAMFVGEQMYFGQDRLDFVREALAG